MTVITTRIGTAAPERRLPLFAMQGAARALTATFGRWRRRAAARRALDSLTLDQLLDVGISPDARRTMSVDARLMMELMSMR